jgi:hypothetical protein
LHLSKWQSRIFDISSKLLVLYAADWCSRVRGLAHRSFKAISFLASCIPLLFFVFYLSLFAEMIRRLFITHLVLVGNLRFEKAFQFDK